MKFKRIWECWLLGLLPLTSSGQGMKTKSSVEEYPEIIKSHACTGIEQSEVKENDFNSCHLNKITARTGLKQETKVTVDHDLIPFCLLLQAPRVENKLKDYIKIVPFLKKLFYTERNNDDKNKNDDCKGYKERKITESDFKKTLLGKKSISVGIKLVRDINRKTYFKSGYFSGDEFLTIKEDNENQKEELIYKDESVLRSDKFPVTNVDHFIEIIKKEKLRSVYVTLTNPSKTCPVARRRDIERAMGSFINKYRITSRFH